jgi:hypothetical protein
VAQLAAARREREHDQRREHEDEGSDVHGQPQRSGR